MKITLLNGGPQAGSLDVYLSEVSAVLQAGGHSVTRIDLRDLDLRYCVGCWNCWVKTPGLCAADAASQEMGRAVINSDFTLWAAPLKMGFPSARMKMGNDKHLPLIHPYMEVDQNEAHHLRRYPRSPRLGLLLEKEAGTDASDLQIVADIYCRTALNFKTRLEFSVTTLEPAAALAARIVTDRPTPLPLPKRLPPTVGATIQPPSRLALFNGSPRGQNGNTPLMLAQIAQGFGGPTDTYHLVRVKETEAMVEAFAQSECALLGFPLYTDSMPAVVKHFIEAIEPLVGRARNPALAFVVQSGFPEGLHSRYIERYLEKLAARLGSPYLGTLVKGNGEAIRVMPPQMNRALFTQLQTLGVGLARAGRFDPAVLKAIASPEQFPAILAPLFQLFIRLPVAHAYFDQMMKENGAYEQRFARPLAE